MFMPGAGFEDVGDDQPDQHRHQGQHEEVADRLDADPAGLAQAVHGGDAEGDDAEDHRDTIILTSAMNQSLSGFRASPTSGRRMPTAMPRTAATTTWNQS